MRRVACGVLGAIAMVVALPTAAMAACPPSCGGDDVTADYSDSGAVTDALSRGFMQGLQQKAARISLPVPEGPFFKYASTSICGGATPTNPVDDRCGADARCAENTPAQGLGPPAAVWEARIDKDGMPVDDADNPIAADNWVRLGVTCLPEMIPGNQPRLTMAQIVAAFHDTEFTKASMNVQPEGNVTLVTLPTYFELRWPATGFQPDEVDSVDPARMSGFRVDIRPRLAAIVYVYGDGARSAPTSSLGGPYPSGDIVHEYAKGGSYQARADVTYGGQYRVNGGTWIDIPGDVTIPGTPETVQVKTAKARLYSNTN